MTGQNGSEYRDDRSRPSDRSSGSGRGSSAIEIEYQTIFDTVDDAVFLVDVGHDGSTYTFTFRRNNPAHEALTGLSTEEIRGTRPHEILDGEDAAAVVVNYRDCVEKRETIEYEETLDHPSGTVEWHTKLTPIVEDDAVTQLVGVARDVTDRNARKRARRRIEQRLSLALDAADAGVWEWDLQSEAVIWDDSMAELLGLEPRAFEGTYEAFIDRVHPDDRDELGRVVETALEQAEGFEHEFRIRHDSGEYIWNITRAELIADAGGNPDRMIGVGIDITDRKERERELDRNRERLRVLFEKAPDGIVVHDADGNVHDVNETLADMLGYERDELRSMTVPDFEVGVDVTELRDRWESMKPGLIHNIEVDGTHRRRDGSTYPVDVWVSKVTPEAEAGPLFIAICRDVTETVEYEQELERYKELVDNVPVGIYRNTPGKAGKFLETNPAMVDLFDADSAEQLLDYDVRDLYADPTARQAFADRLEADGRIAESELELETLSGERFWGSVTAIATTVDGETYFDGVIQDITERKEMEAALRRREERFRRMFERHSAPMLLIDPESGSIQDANEAATEFYGYAAEELTARNIESINRLSPEEVARERTRAEREDRNYFVFHHELASGEVRTVEVHSSPITIADDDFLFSIVHDITERVEYENQLEEQRDNLKILNEVVRHDIRNDLQLVQAYAEMLEGNVSEGMQDELETVRQSAENAIELTTTARDLADVMLQVDVDDKRIALHRTIDREIAEIRSTHPEANVTVEGTLPRTDVVADDMLAAVFRNLLKNAVQHNDEDVPEITVTAEKRDDRVAISVADNGPGVPDERKETIFGKGEKGLESAGTGIGLYLVETLVDRYGGDVWVEDNDPEGAVFVVELQRAS
ncbi:PAS domain-containing sensor histidine kinase [Natrarchaeobius chitinivorans]|uniref:histidine kinase n=1 Tax=Natrarchaeobius chitinivorans TaxID=1679083 RepID=A0A3N6N995_NATCH|nr:PAS domain-containing sensor histidine kinase [Natrarchaeobius chitinivorans]RQG95092.1 PAS domain S-box protein [Natrarchaeobius chitinivorans]